MFRNFNKKSSETSKLLITVHENLFKLILKSISKFGNISKNLKIKKKIVSKSWFFVFFLSGSRQFHN